MAESNWTHTRATLLKLKSLLNCNHCKKPMSDPHFLESCKHTFCRACIKNQTCPECHIPALANQITPSRLISNVMLLATQLQNVLGDTPVNSFAKDDTTEVLLTSKVKIDQHTNSDKKKNLKMQGTLTYKNTSYEDTLLQNTPKEAAIDESDGVEYDCDSSTREKRNAKGETNLLIAGIKLQNVFDDTSVNSFAKVDTTEALLTSKEKIDKLTLSDKKKEQEMQGTLLCKNTSNEDTILQNTPKKAAIVESDGLEDDCNSPNQENTPKKAAIVESDGLEDDCNSPNQESLIKVQDVRPTTPLHSLPTTSQKKNAKGETQLHIACIKGDTVKVKNLLQEGANPNTKDNAGWTPLHEASHHNSLEIVGLLIKHGALINTPGYDNETPLHDAVHMNNINIVSFLVRHGADTQARNARGLTPLDLAKSVEVENALKTTVSISFAKTSPSPKLNTVQQKAVVLSTGLSRKQKHQLQVRTAEMLRFILVEEYTDKVTHVVTDTDEEGQCFRTLKYLRAVLGGKWILSFTWVELSLECRRKIDEEAFEVHGTKNCPNSFGAKKGRENALQQLPQLFDGCNFYFYGTFDSPWPQRSELCMLIRSGGGKVLKREPRYVMMDGETHRVPYHLKHKFINTFVVYGGAEPLKHDSLGDNVCHVHISWLLDSISSFTLLPFDHKQDGR